MGVNELPQQEFDFLACLSMCHLCGKMKNENLCKNEWMEAMDS